jgi:hypothetical protein
MVKSPLPFVAQKFLGPRFLLSALALASLVVALLAVLAPGLVSVGCVSSRESFPPLLQVTEVGPSEVEVGDKLELRGEGFPVGKIAIVTFRGAVYRLGEAPLPQAELRVRGFAATGNIVELRIDDEVRAAFTGPSAHATFRGEVEVAFAAPRGSIAPVYGVLHAAVFDVRGPDLPQNPAWYTRIGMGAQAFADGGGFSARQGEGLLHLQGISAELSGPQLVVRDVEAGSPAASAGLVSGDVLVAWDGLNVRSFADVSLETDAQRVEVLVRRPGQTHDQALSMMLHPAASIAPRDAVLGTLGVFAFAILVVVLFGARWQAFDAVVQVMASAGGGPRERNPAVHVLAGAFVFALFAAMPYLRYLLVQQFDLPILFALLITMNAVAQARGVRGGWVVMLVSQLTLGLALLATSFLEGSLAFADAWRGQGAEPWRWNVAQDPARVVLFVVVVAASVIEVPRPNPSKALERARLVLASAVVTTLFLGAGRMPETWEVSRYRDIVTVIGALVFVAKAFGVMWILEHVKVVVLRAHEVELRRLVVRWLLPAALLASASGALLVYFDVAHRTGALLGHATFAALFLLVARAVKGAASEGWTKSKHPDQTFGVRAVP